MLLSVQPYSTRRIACLFYGRTNAPCSGYPLLGFADRRIRTAAAYTGVPFANQSSNLRSKVFQAVARRVDEISRAFQTQDPEVGEDYRGHSRGKGREAYDWLRVQGAQRRRVEAKYSSIIWTASRSRWTMQLQGVKVDEFDDLILVVYAPWGLVLWEYDMNARIGYSTTGRITAMRGGTITFCGKQNVECLVESWRLSLCPRLNLSAKHVTTSNWGHELLANVPHSSMTERTYAGVPLAMVSPQRRGVILQHLARQHEDWSERFETLDALLNLAVNGAILGHHSRSYDWRRCDSRIEHRVEAKSGGFTWQRRLLCWRLRFSAIKLDKFDVLVLTIYAPWGVEFWEHAGVSGFGLSLNGSRTEVMGMELFLHGKKGETELEEAWRSTIRPRLQLVARHIATLGWQDELFGEIRKQ